MKKIEEMEFIEVIQLYEKGLIGEKRVKELFGIKTDNESKHPKDSDIALQRIEQARRNVEALSRMRDWEDGKFPEISDAIKKNIKIMNEVEKL